MHDQAPLRNQACRADAKTLRGVGDGGQATAQALEDLSAPRGGKDNTWHTVRRWDIISEHMAHGGSLAMHWVARKMTGQVNDPPPTMGLLRAAGCH
eukprot:7224873-Alexandrium_andersonii.AAC.1